MAHGNGSSKIFGIGLNKTGTTTFGQCGKILGYRCTSCDRSLLEDIILRNDFTNIKNTVNQYDLFEDWPWPLIYKELDQMFPGSKFVLTVRKDEKVWLNSLKNHSMRTHITRHCRKLVYGYNFPHQYEKEHIEFYNLHNETVRSYFKGRENNFLEICWENDHDWDELCSFLGKDIPHASLPHGNKGSEQRIKPIRFIINRLLRGV